MVSLENDGKLFYPPSYTGVAQKQKLGIKNDSRIPVEFEFRIPDKFKKEVLFDPMRTTLKPNEETHVSATFTPLKKREYEISLPLQV